MTDMIERIAPLVYAAMWPNNDPAVPWSAIQNEAAKAPVYEATRAVIAAMREPTEAMTHCGAMTPEGFQAYPNTCEAIWAGMIDAALGAEAASPAERQPGPRESI